MFKNESNKKKSIKSKDKKNWLESICQIHGLDNETEITL
jgi:hypothetical protein